MFYRLIKNCWKSLFSHGVCQNKIVIETTNNEKKSLNYWRESWVFGALCGQRLFVRNSSFCELKIPSFLIKSSSTKNKDTENLVVKWKKKYLRSCDLTAHFFMSSQLVSIDRVLSAESHLVRLIPTRRMTDILIQFIIIAIIINKCSLHLIDNLCSKKSFTLWSHRLLGE